MIHLTFRQGDDVAAVPEDLTGCIFRRLLRQELHRRLGGNGFAAARFTDDAHSFTGIDVQRDIVDGFQEAAVGMEGNRQVTDI